MPQDNKRLRSIKQTTVHGCAQSGDLITLQKLLQENPSAINLPNPVLLHTPLHVSCGHNKVEVIKFLLEWQGPEKVKVDAVNMYGETPLHMAAKNGSDEAANLLLAKGANIEAKACNGMTPLHLAVCGYSLSPGNALMIKTLLDYSADCSAKDNDGRTPLDHLSQVSGSDIVIKLFEWRIEEQKKHRAIEACTETKAKMDELEVALSQIVGLNEIKSQLRKWAKGMLLDMMRRSLGLKIGSRKLPHMAFLGNPGTGKTMVARVLGKLLYMVGLLPTDKITEVQRTDLVGEFVGHTGPKTRRKIKEAEGGILFVDEAYRLIPVQKSDDKDYGLEALEEIMSIMDSGKVVVIFAGYKEPMKRVISSNEGFCRRVTKFFYFDDFSTEDLATIVHLKMNNQTEDSLLYGFKLHHSCRVDAIAALIERETKENLRKEMNGGLVDAMLVNARENLDLRLSLDCLDTTELLTITLEDLEAGLRFLPQETKKL